VIRPFTAAIPDSSGFPAELRHQCVVIGVRADPVPDHVRSLKYANRPPARSYPHGENRVSLVNLLETKARMIRILPP